ncbi:PREDICTED: venom dipeptidyl peptidase 4 [Ceratosolen solmsi marchali]|uniref:Venom dipeptidyl peptidase 4 n=1 Tax=Ceratosolen solmsi marchali TaxID=326594 RepID=A0AAJ7DZ15_9HYME|nr:PREDICTED: venom dipeptidyl peptidase 4 [Ceratosolen solmsi marchali]
MISTYVLTINELEFKNNVDVKKAFTLDDIISNAYSSDTFNGTWISETEIFYRVDELLLKFDVTIQKSDIVMRNRLFEESDNLEFFLSSDNNYLLIRNTSQNIYRHSSLSQYSICNIKTESIVAVADGQLLSTAIWAPKGSALVYVLNNDIYYHQLIGEAVETRRLTFDGKHQEIYNGVPDWVYEEEVLASDTAMWISPTGEYLVFATFNDTQVLESIILRYGKPGDLSDQYPVEEKFRYPKVGTPNPEVTLNLIDLTDHGSPLISLKIPVDIVGPEAILFAVRWFDPKTFVATWTNRVQNLSQIVSYSVNGDWQPLFSEEEPNGWLLSTDEAPIHHNGYVLIRQPKPIVNTNLGSFIHVIRYRLLNGVLDHETDLTPGATWVHALHGVNDVKRVVYYTASPVGKSSEKHLYAVSLETPEDSISEPNCLSCQLKTPEGNQCSYVSSVLFSTDFSHYVLTCSGPDPAIIKVYDLDGTELYTWTANSELRHMLDKRILPEQRDLHINSHGFEAKVRLFLPEDFNSSAQYPMLVNVYAGPGSQRINDGFSVGFESYMTTNRHVVYALIDGRGSVSKGTAILFAVYRNLGSAEIEDQITVTRKLQEKYPWIDKNRTAIWGWSYGGYSTAMVLTKDYDNVFKCGISVAPVTNWIYYDSIYTERFMGLPTVKDNLKNYETSSVLSRVKKLADKKYMLVHGTGDDNVHFQQSMAMAKELTEADILFDQVSYADEPHSLYRVTKHLYHTMDNFWTECFDY